MYKRCLGILFLTLFSFMTLLHANEPTKSAEANTWHFDRFNFYFEDDIYSQTDNDYSAGERLSFLYFIENEEYVLYNLLFLDYDKSYSYATFSLTNQIFTPTDTDATELIVDDRPYAGWTYFEAGMHKTSKNHLRSLLLKLGIIGEYAFSGQLQNGIHKFINNDLAKGWDNQLNNELGVNLKYTHKWIFLSQEYHGFESSIVPFASAELGNVAINAEMGAFVRLGWNIPKDFGVSSVDLGADPGIPNYDKYQESLVKHWSFSINLAGAGSAVARDIFLDGNTFSESHSVEKENFIYYYGFGMTLRYQRFVLDFIQVHNSKKFKLEKKGHGVGTLVFSWLF